MATSEEFAGYIREQTAEVGEVPTRRMFGEYGVYCQGKFVGMVCNNQLFIKITPAGKRLLPEARELPPYKEARPYLLVEQLEDRALLALVLTATAAELPAPKPKKPKSREKK